MKKSEIQAKMRELQGKMADIASDGSKAEEFAKLDREFKSHQAQLAMMEAEEREQKEEPKSKGEQMREMLQQLRQEGKTREVTLGTQGVASGAIELEVKDLVPNLEEGNGLPAAVQVVSGVVGNAVFPTDASDMEIEELGEVADCKEQVVNFDKVEVKPKRCSISCAISNSLIDNAAFDIMAHIRNKFAKAWRKHLALKVYSQAKFTGVKGGFSGLEKAGDVTLGNGSAYKSILQAVAKFASKGFDAESMCLVIDAETEADLKMEPKQKGVAGYVIENGKLCGYDYVVTSKINTVLGGDAKTDGGNSEASKLYPTKAKYIGIGCWEYLKVQQHGEVRMTLDATSMAMAKKNCTGLVLNTELSVTDLSDHIYDEAGNKVKAFAVYEIKAGV